jgi:cell division protease FtsH
MFDRISTGALNDLEKVTRQARAIVSVYGLNEKIGNLTYYDSSGQADYNFTKPYSERTAQIIDEEISNIIEKQYERAVALLKKHKEKLTQLAEILIEKEVIFEDDLKKIFGDRPFKKEIEFNNLKTVNKNKEEEKEVSKDEISEETSK